jgi:hypothetical protein
VALLIRQAREGLVFRMCYDLASAEGAAGPRRGQKSTLHSTIQVTN